jgi:hypothetical protein
VNKLDANNWFLLIPLFLSVLAGLLPAQYNVRVLQEEGYDRKRFADRFKDDKDYWNKRKNLSIILRVGMLVAGVFAIILSAIICWMIINSIALTVVVIVGAISAASIVCNVISYYKLPRFPNKLERVNFRNIRLDIGLFLVIVLFDVLLIFVVTLVFYGLMCIVHAPGSAANEIGLNTMVIVGFITVIANYDLPSATFFHSFASLLLQPIEIALEKRKKIA